ncbi:cytochrome P450 [Kitasatospora sp. NPDC048194]|uniref:cytochrome P450 n=1 Tax=Kitasatospora sp. NPDC048194 TaxID=3364045 RepID=UPI00371C3436
MTHPIFADYSKADPLPAMRGMTDSVSTYEPAMKALFVNTHAEVRALLREPALQNAKIKDPLLESLPPEQYRLHRPIKAFMALWPLFSQGDYHTGVRECLRPAFTAAALEPLLVDARRYWDASVDELLRREGPVEWVESYAYPCARRLLAGFFGIPEDRLLPALNAATDITQYMARPLSLTDDSLAHETLDAIERLRDETHRTIIGTGDGPAATALADIARTPGLGPDAAVATAAQLITGALDPLAALFAEAVRRQGRQPGGDDRDLAGRTTGSAADGRSTERPATAAELTEETLRLGCPFRFVQRHVTAPLTVDGHRLERGDRLLLGLGPANLDPAVFPDPLEFRPGGDQRPAHLAFGFGAHYCPGALLARGVVQALFEALLERGAVAVVDEESLERSPYLSVGKVISLTVSLR